MPSPAVGQIQFLDADGVSQIGSAHYEGRWLVHLPAITSPPGDGLINELDFTVALPGFPGLYVGIYVGNDSDGDPARFATDQILDSAALPSWVTFSGNYITPAAGWSGGLSLQTWDGGWNVNPLSPTSFITVDAANSDPAWTDWAPPAHISSFSPTSGVAGDTVVITGVGFTSAFYVNVSNGGTSFTVDSDTQITATLGAFAEGDLSVVVGVNLSGGGVAYVVAFEFLTFHGPHITGHAPDHGAPGDTVVITGVGFTGATAVQIGQVLDGPFTIDSDTQISAVIAPDALPGPDYIYVTVPGPVIIHSPAADFTVDTVPGPAVTGFTPMTAAAGDSVVITGSNFTGATDVQFRNAASFTAEWVSAATFTVDSDSQITAVVPADAITGPLRVLAPTGTGVSGDSLLIPATTGVASVSPSPRYEAQEITVTGTGFTGVTDLYLVSGGSGYSQSFVIDSDTQIRFPVASGTPFGYLPVWLNGSGITVLSYQTVQIVAAPPPPSIDSVAPASAHRGDTVVVHGAHFTGVPTVEIGGVAATFTVDSDTQITAVVPSTAAYGDGYVFVMTTTGGFGAAIAFHVIAPPPVITSIGIGTDVEHAGETDVYEGYDVHMHGSNFIGVLGVTLGGDSLPFTVVDSTHVTARVVTSTTPELFEYTSPADLDPQDIVLVLVCADGSTATPTLHLWPGAFPNLVGNGLPSGDGRVDLGLVCFDGVNLVPITDTTSLAWGNDRQTDPDVPAIVGVVIDHTDPEALVVGTPFRMLGAGPSDYYSSIAIRPVPGVAAVAVSADWLITGFFQGVRAQRVDFAGLIPTIGAVQTYTASPFPSLLTPLSATRALSARGPSDVNLWAYGSGGLGTMLNAGSGFDSPTEINPLTATTALVTAVRSSVFSTWWVTTTGDVIAAGAGNAGGGYIEASDPTKYRSYLPDADADHLYEHEVQMSSTGSTDTVVRTYRGVRGHDGGSGAFAAIVDFAFSEPAPFRDVPFSLADPDGPDRLAIGLGTDPSDQNAYAQRVLDGSHEKAMGAGGMDLGNSGSTVMGFRTVAENRILEVGRYWPYPFTGSPTSVALVVRPIVGRSVLKTGGLRWGWPLA